MGSVLRSLAPVQRANQPEPLVNTGQLVSGLPEGRLPLFGKLSVLVRPTAAAKIGEPLAVACQPAVQHLDLLVRELDVSHPDRHCALVDAEPGRAMPDGL